LHSEAYNWVHDTFHAYRLQDEALAKECNIHPPDGFYSILEIGSLDINGTVRGIFKPWTFEYLGIDPQEGPGVDKVAFGHEFSSRNSFDIIVTTETFEHTDKWKEIIQRSYENLMDGGIFIATMAGEGRPPHSAIDENPIRDFEHYANIGEWDLNKTLRDVGFADVHTNKLGTDLRCYAVKRESNG
jgi:hypothetical protein